MENIISQLRETLDNLLSDLNGRAEEVRENFASFKEVFGKEFELQADNFKGYREKLEDRRKKIFKPEELVTDIKEDLDIAVRDLRSNVDRLYDRVKDRIDKAK